LAKQRTAAVLERTPATSSDGEGHSTGDVWRAAVSQPVAERGLLKKSALTGLVIGGGCLLGLGAKILGKRRESRRDTAMRRLTTHFIIPVWIAAGFVDYLWHRRTHIETTSGLTESLTHSLMMLEAAPAVLAPLFLEINARVLRWMIGLAVLHEVTVLWDLAYTESRRRIPAGEQITHTFLESPPFLVTAAAIVNNWDQFMALLGKGWQRPRSEIRFQMPPVSFSTLLGIFGAMGLFGALPHVNELRRCFRAKWVPRGEQKALAA
jgi:hypothetical protein